MNIKKVFESLVNTGGATYSFNTGELNPDYGYSVALPDMEQICPWVPNFETFKACVKPYVNNTLDLLSEEGNFLGLWLHEGNLYMDVTRVVPTFWEALQKGIAGNQIAIWNNASRKLIEIAPIKDMR